MAMYNSTLSAFITNKSTTGAIVIKCVGITEDTVNVSVYSHVLSYTSLVRGLLNPAFVLQAKNAGVRRPGIGRRYHSIGICSFVGHYPANTLLLYCVLRQDVSSLNSWMTM